MRAFYSEAQSGHAPALELQNGELVAHAEKAARVDAIKSALPDLEPADDFGLEPILAVHDADYVAFLQRAHADWRAAGRAGDAFPYVFPVKGRRPLNLKRIDAELGRYAYDCGTPVAAGTWDAVYGSAQTALTGMRSVLNSGKPAFAFCRPPGHHAGPDYMGGYSYLNAAAIATQYARDQGVERAAVLDVDYHHGNGTQDIFYERSDVLTISLHADPVMDYPFYWGHADERGERGGEGFNLNLPMMRGTLWLSYKAQLAKAIERVAAFDPQILVVPFGADTYAKDPISFFKIETADYVDMGAMIAGLNLPTLICMEGGYAIEALGANVSAFLSGFTN